MFFPKEFREAKALEFMNMRQCCVSIQEYILNFTLVFRYALNMVADPKAKMSKFLFGVSYLVKTECINAMFLEDMNNSRLMNHAHQVEGAKFKEQGMDNKKDMARNYKYSQQKLGGGNHSLLQNKSSALTPSSASAPFPRLL